MGQRLPPQCPSQVTPPPDGTRAILEKHLLRLLDPYDLTLAKLPPLHLPLSPPYEITRQTGQQQPLLLPMHQKQTLAGISVHQVKSVTVVEAHEDSDSGKPRLTIREASLLPV